MRLDSNGLLNLIAETGLVADLHDDEVSLVCPLCSDYKQRLYINQTSGLWLCFNCGRRGNLAAFVEEVLGYPPMEAYHHARRLHGDAPARIQPQHPAVAVPVEMPEGFTRLSNPSAEFERPYWQYLASRGVGLPQVMAHRMGYTLVGREAYRVIIPVRQHDVVYGWIARAIYPNMQPKVLTPSGAKMSWLLFNYDAVRGTSDEVILVEGVFDALAVRGSVATFGAKLSVEQRRLLRQAGFKRVVLMWDADRAGEAGMNKAASELVAAGFDVAIARLPEGVDPAEASSVEITEALANREPVNLLKGVSMM